MMDFWARRKAAVEAEARAEAKVLAAQEAAETEAQLEARDDAALLAELDLPDPDTADTPDQLREILNAALPQRLKTRALRRMWRLNPMLANLDGLVDYGQDFTDSAMVVENMQTAYQVGKGMLKAFAEPEESAAPAANATAETSDEAAPDTASDPAPAQDAPAEGDQPTEAAPRIAAVTPAPAAPETPPDAAPARPRRMRFAFDA